MNAVIEPRFHIEPLAAPLGARVLGLDARQDPSAAQILALRQALRDHHILIFPEQWLNDAQFARFSSWFGAVFQPHPDFEVLSSGTSGQAPTIVKVANTEDGELGNGPLPSHIDHQWTPTPSASSLLWALEVPEEGGETRWTNLAAAYEALDAATRTEIDALHLITYNPFARRRQEAGGYGRILYRTPDVAPIQGTSHPLVRTHPDSGRRLLYLSVGTEVEILDYPAERGAALIERLREHLQDPRFSYTHRWQAGDIVHWDNQATLHGRNAFPADQLRRLQRISLAGSRPF